MAVSSATSWSDTTPISGFVGACRITSVRVTLLPTAAATSYIQLYDGTGVTPGTTAPLAVLPVLAPSGNRTKSFPLPGGLYCSTGLEWFVSTTHDNGTAVTTSAPLKVDVHYAPGG